MTEKEFFQETGSLVFVQDFAQLRKQVGFRRASVSLFVRYRYIVKLWLLRELSIYLILIENYAKVPRWTPTKLILFPAVKLAFVKNLIIRSVNRLQNSFIKNI